MKASSDKWFASLRPHVQAAYRLSSSSGYLQIPLFLELYPMLGYPEVAELRKDLCNGMPMLGTSPVTWLAT